MPINDPDTIDPAELAHGELRVPFVPSLPDDRLPAIAVGVLNYNRADRTLATLRELVGTDYPADKLAIVVIDNGSVDDSVARIGAEFGERVEIIRLPDNIGPVARNRVILGRPEPYTFVFDEDCVPERSDTLKSVVMIMEANPELGAFCFRSFNAGLGIFEYGDFGSVGRRRPDGIYEGLFVIGNGMCFRTSAARRTDGYDERLFFAAEEFDFGFELLYHDVRIGYHPDVRLLHYHAPRANPSVRVWELDMRNNVLTLVRRLPFALGVPLLLLQISRRLLVALLQGNRERLGGYLRGIGEALGRLPEFIATRKPVPVRKLIPHAGWLVHMFYTPRSFARKHRQLMRERMRPTHELTDH